LKNFTNKLTFQKTSGFIVFKFEFHYENKFNKKKKPSPPIKVHDEEEYEVEKILTIVDITENFNIFQVENISFIRSILETSNKSELSRIT